MKLIKQYKERVSLLVLVLAVWACSPAVALAEIPPELKGGEAPEVFTNFGATAIATITVVLLIGGSLLFGIGLILMGFSSSPHAKPMTVIGLICVTIGGAFIGFIEGTGSTISSFFS